MLDLDECLGYLDVFTSAQSASHARMKIGVIAVAPVKPEGNEVLSYAERDFDVSTYVVRTQQSGLGCPQLLRCCKMVIRFHCLECYLITQLIASVIISHYALASRYL